MLCDYVKLVISTCHYQVFKRSNIKICFGLKRHSTAVTISDLHYTIMAKIIHINDNLKKKISHLTLFII